MVYLYERISKDETVLLAAAENTSSVVFKISDTRIRYQPKFEKDGDCVISVGSAFYTPEHQKKYNWGGMSVEDAVLYLPDNTWEVYKTEAWDIWDPCWDPSGVYIYCHKKEIK